MTRRWWLASLLGIIACGEGQSPGQVPNGKVKAPLSSAFDPRLEPIRRAATAWESRQGPERAVVNQVCLVPDLPTFLEAIASWDRGHYFPILFDDVESSFRFIRAFRPARIVRMPKSAAPIAATKIWDRAVEAVGASWSMKDGANPPGMRGDAVPKSIGPTPPGMVFSSSSAPMLAGAVALAAGRFQPLLRLDSAQRFADDFSIEQMDAFGQAIEAKVTKVAPLHESLGDDCDFLTIAGDYPYRYRDEKGDHEAVDDRIGRSAANDQRWAYAGRLLGDATNSAYRAMCSLFLQPDSAVMFNGYNDSELPWSIYSMQTASLRLSTTLPTSHVGLEMGSLAGWHETFDPMNRFGLVLINSLGGPSMFGIRGAHAHPPDIPRSVPSVVLMIHSFSAADPTDPDTIAGRWLANGAFVYYGSMNEPFLDAFRTPRLIAEMLNLKVPVVVAVRQLPSETRGMPWRLAFLGDPLYQIRPKSATGAATRLDRWGSTGGWPAYVEGPRPAADADVDLLFWSLKVALARLQVANRGSSPPAADDLVDALLEIRREKLPEAFRPVHDSLLTEVLLEAKKRGVLKARLIAIPNRSRNPAVRRTIETLEGIDFNLGLTQKDPAKARAAWRELMNSSTPREFKQQATSSIGALAWNPALLEDWRAFLKATLQDRSRPVEPEIVADELKRVDEALKKAR